MKSHVIYTTLIVAFLLVTAPLLARIPSFNRVLGADFRNISKTEASRMGIIGGVIVTRIYPGGSLAAQTKMHAGFVITKIGELPVMSISGLNFALSQQKGHFVIQGIYPGIKQPYYFTIHDF